MSDIRCAEETLDRAGMLERAARLARVMQAYGIGRESVVALLSRNRLSVLVVHLAARRIDASVLPVNWHDSVSEVAYILADGAPTLLIGENDLVARMSGHLPPGLGVLTFGQAYEQAVAAAFPSSYVADGLGSAVIYTSGTSGRPKGVRRLPASPAEATHRQAVLRHVYDAWPDNRALATGPLYHLFSLATALSNIAAGGGVTIMPQFDPEEMLRLIARDRITHTSLVPTMMARLLRLPDRVKARYDLSSLRHVVQSGAPCPHAVKQGMIDWLGPIFHETYGSTETGVITMIGSHEWLARPTSVGKPIASGEVRVLDEAGAQLPPGVAGDIYLRMHGTPDFTYVNDPEKRFAMERCGLVTVGDIGWLDQDGYLHVCDRRGDMVIVGGVNIYPAEVEDALMAHPMILDAAVLGVPDEDYGERLVAHIALVVGASLDETAVFAHLADHLGKPKWPRSIVIDRALPRAENGKILKRLLRDRYLARSTT